MFNSGTVDVAVFPPIPVDDWTVENLPERIEEVRQLYLDTLKNWPHDKLPEPDLYRLPKAPAKKAPAKKAAAKKAAKKTPAKRTAAKKAAAKSNTAAGASRRTGANGRP